MKMISSDLARKHLDLFVKFDFSLLLSLLLELSILKLNSKRWGLLSNLYQKTLDCECLLYEIIMQNSLFSKQHPNKPKNYRNPN
ncbi:hypothetical protein PROSTU_02562 [Providencia stuartii ATCC 25827]|uniref:Uncharacterized protein n=1 Tax=Providencia stuartii ATCC 25827 TaxID=471874 RepID=A0AA87CUA0_PROST|nr:hypothetical protein PROSTU_02562 [Providencia stuartii ATCC 25827]